MGWWRCGAAPSEMVKIIIRKAKGKICPEKNSITMLHDVGNARDVRSFQADLNGLLERIRWPIYCCTK